MMSASWSSVVHAWLSATADPALTASAYPWDDVMFAGFLVALAVGLVVAEIFVTSLGLLVLGAAICCVWSLSIAFGVSATTGLVFLLVIPVVGLCVVRWGLQHLQRSSLVPQATISTDAGYHHALDRLGLAIGARGTLTTDAVPSGRAHFVGTVGSDELDVTVTGAAGQRGDPVRLVCIEGPTLVVVVEPREASV